MVENSVVERELSSAAHDSMRIGRVNVLHLPGGGAEPKTDTSFHVLARGEAHPSSPKPRQPSSEAQRIQLRRRSVVIGNGQRIASNYVLEWSPPNGNKWYPINYRGVTPHCMTDEAFLEAYRAAMNRVLRGETVEVTAEYTPLPKTLLVKEV